MAHPKISIVTVCRNAQNTIATALESVAKQNGVPDGALEHLIIDGKSTDNTLETVKRFPHAKVVSEPDAGISDAFSKGARLATGDWVLYLNSDDMLADSNVIEDALKELDPEFDVIYGKIEIADETLSKVLRVTGDPNGWKHLGNRMTIAHPATLMHKRYFETYGYFDNAFKIAMDYELLLRGYGKTKFKFIPRTINRFRSGGVSTDKADLRQSLECWRAKSKNHIGSAPARFAWFCYQTVRYFLDRNMPKVPGLGKLYTCAIGRLQKNY